jgi:Arc/MetJ-type ribon-helix-helix transcriptional regulator
MMKIVSEERAHRTCYNYNTASDATMSDLAKKIQLPADLQEFAEERVRAGQSASVDDVVLEAMKEKKLAVLRAALDEGIAELDAGLGVETTPAELVAEISAEVGLDS